MNNEKSLIAYYKVPNLINVLKQAYKRVLNRLRYKNIVFPFLCMR